MISHRSVHNIEAEWLCGLQTPALREGVEAIGDDDVVENSHVDQLQRLTL
jgi:hypothetical protein